MAGGIAYETPRATTEAEMMALSAELEPRKMHPNITTRAVVRYNAFNGKPRRG